MASTYHFTTEQGATFNLTFTWRDGAGNPVDLTGYSAELSIKRGETVLLELNEVDGTVLEGAASTVRFKSLRLTYCSPRRSATASGQPTKASK